MQGSAHDHFPGGGTCNSQTRCWPLTTKASITQSENFDFFFLVDSENSLFSSKNPHPLNANSRGVFFLFLFWREEFIKAK